MRNRLLNYKAILLSTVIAIVVSALWYSLFSDAWMKATGLNQELVSENLNMYSYIISIIASFAGIWVLAWLIIKLDINSALNGALLGLILSLAFHFLPSASENSFAMKSNSLLFIYAGINALNLCIAGIILTLWKKYKDE